MFKTFSFNKLIDDDYRIHIQMIMVPLIAGIVSFGMFILNIFTHKTILMYSTFIYAVLSFLNVWLEYHFKNERGLTVVILAGTTIALFTSFLLYGGTEGFSPIWICALPPCALLMTGRKRGVLICAVMFAFMIFFLWTPLGNSFLKYQYTKSFLMRFPLVYIAIFLVGLLFETIRAATYDAFIKLQKQYKELTIRDSLTGAYNRYWFNETLTEILKKPESRPIALLIIDIDNFKLFNDEHGHLFGDKVLKAIAGVLQEKTSGKGSVCRWGGEEFAILMERCEEARMAEVGELLRNAVALTLIEDENGDVAGVTISIGMACLTGEDIGFDQFVSLADHALYNAKTSGRNCIRMMRL